MILLEQILGGCVVPTVGCTTFDYVGNYVDILRFWLLVHLRIGIMICFMDWRRLFKFT